MSEQKLEVKIHQDTLTGGSIYSVHVPPHLMAAKIERDILYNVMGTIVDIASKEILKEHGATLVGNILSKENDVCGKILAALTNNIDKLVDLLNHFQRDYQDGRLCSCRKQHGKYERYTQPDCKPLDNLGYLEQRYDIMKQWVDSLKIGE